MAAFIIWLFAVVAILGHPASASSHGCDNGIAVPSQEAGLIAACQTLLDAKAILDPNDVLDWSVDTAVASWEGISVSNGRVTRLSAGAKRLTGSIPAELGGLTDLTYLDLYDNNLTGPVSPELGDLTDLTYLHLYGNDLNGPIPPELGDLDDLTSLQLHNNGLSGSIPPELGDLIDRSYPSLVI